MKSTCVLLVLMLLYGYSSAAVIPTQAVRELTDRDFQTTVQNNDALVTFFSPSCPHCVSFLPELDKVATTLRSSGSPVLVAKVNCGEGGRSTCSQNAVKTVPTIRLYRHGQAGGDFLGQRNSEAVVNYVYAGSNFNGFQQDSYNYNANNNAYSNNGYPNNGNIYNGYNTNGGYNTNNIPGNYGSRPY